MKKPLYILFASAYLAMMTLSSVSCAREKNELVHDHAHEHGHDHEGHDHEEHEHEGHDHDHEHEGHEGHDHGSGDEIVLEPSQAEQFGVKTMTVSAGGMNDVIKVTGEVGGTAASAGSFVAPTAGVFTFSSNITVGSTVSKGQLIGTIRSTGVTGGDRDAIARVTLDAAKREYERLKPLYEKRLITVDRYNQALADYNIAKAAYSPSAAAGRVTAPISGTVTSIDVAQGQIVEPGTVIGTVSDNSELTITFDVPDRYSSRIPNITDARINIAGASEPVDLSNLGGYRITSGVTSTSRPGYVPVVFTFKSTGILAPGAIVDGYLLGRMRDNVVFVPASAISEQQGNYFVYVKVDEEGYLKSPVTLGSRDGKNIEITKGLHPGDEVVVEGVTAVKLAEKSGVVPEGHSHSH